MATQDEVRAMVKEHVVMNATWLLPAIKGREGVDYIYWPFVDSDAYEAMESVGGEDEVYEAYFVDEWLADALLERDEAVVSCSGTYDIWLRCGTGQRVYMDYVMERITEEER